MSIAPVLMPHSSVNAIRVVEPAHASANTASNGPFDGESVYDERVAQRRAADRRKSAVSQNGTSDFAPLWHGPMLSPTFVAQVLGQVLMDNRPQASAPSAYRSGTQVGSGRVLNRAL